MIFYREQYPGDKVFTSNKPTRGVGQTPDKSLQEYLDDIKKYEVKKPILKKIKLNGVTKKPNRDTNTSGDLVDTLEKTYCRPSYAFSCPKRKHIQ